MRSEPGSAVESGIGYRPDIDGLRAIAVAAVVLFHAALPGVPGGFVGVDVFFVISGFLIGGQIYREGIAGRFSYASFYARRARRILPAFLTLLLVCYAAGVVALTPLELKELGKEAVAAVFAVSNILFYLGGGYFAPDADRNPLLMTWSLGVEEQFYILFPIILLLLLKQRLVSPLAAVIALSVLSLAGSFFLMAYNPTAAFYLLPTRAWELGLGAALAIAGILRGKPLALAGPAGTALAILSLAALGASIVLYQPSIAFPGWYVLFPTLATAALIATPQTGANRHLLGNRLMQFIGKISYSWYLWHWPVFYLNRILEGPQGGTHGAVLIVLTLVLATLSWRFVETPLRHRVLPQSTVLWRYALASLAVAAPALSMYYSGGWIARLPEPARAMALDARAAQEGVCLTRYGSSELRDPARCLPAQSDTRKVAVLGDSHADAIAAGIRQVAKEARQEAAVLTKSSCAPLLGYAFSMAGRPAHHMECIAYQQRAFETVANRPDIQVVVLAGYWRQLLLDPLTGRNGASVPLDTALNSTVAYLRRKGKRVILVQDVPGFDIDPYARTIGSLMPARVALSQWTSTVPVTTGKALADADRSRAMLMRVAKAQGVELWDPRNMLCEGQMCTFASDGTLYYSDGQHLTVAGARAATRGLPLTGTR